jgi:hypothetical protein
MKYIYRVSLLVSELCTKQSSKCKNEQRAITPKLGEAELWFFCNALLFNEFMLIPLMVSELCPGLSVKKNKGQ